MRIVTQNDVNTRSFPATATPMIINLGSIVTIFVTHSQATRRSQQSLAVRWAEVSSSVENTEVRFKPWRNRKGNMEENPLRSHETMILSVSLGGTQDYGELVVMVLSI